MFYLILILCQEKLRQNIPNFLYINTDDICAGSNEINIRNLHRNNILKRENLLIEPFNLKMPPDLDHQDHTLTS